MKKHVVLIIIIIAICASIVAYALLSKEKEYEFDWDRFHDDIATIKQQYYASSDVIKDTVNLLWENEDVCSIVSFSDSVSVCGGAGVVSGSCFSVSSVSNWKVITTSASGMEKSIV